MKATIAIAALVTLLAPSLSVAQTANRVELEYYKTHNCTSSTGFSAVFLEPSNGCYNLGYTSKSIHIGGPASQRQVQPGCVVKGYGSKGCTGSVNVQIVGRSDADTCYASNVDGPRVKPINSVQQFCTSD